MLSSDLRRELANDLGFRLALNQAVGARPPLNGWVIRNVVSDESFFGLFGEVLTSLGPIGRDLDETYHSMLQGQREELFRRLSSNERLALLVAEWMERSNERMRVLAGLESRLGSLWESLSTSAPPPDHAPAKDTHAPPFSLSGLTGRSPLLQWGLAGALGIATLGTAGTFVVQSREISKELATISKESSEISKEVTRISDRSFQSIEKIESISRETQSITERIGQRQSCGEIKTGCKEAIGPQGPLPNPWTIKLDGMPSFTMYENKPDGAQQKVASTLPNTWTVKLDGIPNIPNSFRLEPNYRVEALPASSVPLTASTPTLLRVEYPTSYEVASECELSVTLVKLADLAEVTFERQKSCDVERVARETSITIKPNDKPIYVAELDAFVGLSSRRGGLFHTGKRSVQISIQAAAFSPRKGAANVGLVDVTRAGATVQAVGP